MLGYIFLSIGIFIVAICVAVFLAGTGNKKKKPGSREDEKKGTTYAKPQAEQIRPADDQASKNKS